MAPTPPPALRMSAIAGSVRFGISASLIGHASFRHQPPHVLRLGPDHARQRDSRRVRHERSILPAAHQLELRRSTPHSEFLPRSAFRTRTSDAGSAAGTTTIRFCSRQAGRRQGRCRRRRARLSRSVRLYQPGDLPETQLQPSLSSGAPDTLAHLRLTRPVPGARRGPLPCRGRTRRGGGRSLPASGARCSSSRASRRDCRSI